MCRNYLVFRPRNDHPYFLEQIRCLCEILSVCCVLQLNRAIEQYPVHFHPFVHLWYCCPTGGSCTWDCAVCSTNPAHLSTHIVVFQCTSRFSLLEAWTTFKALICFPYSLSDWLLLLLLTAITSVLCIIKIFPI